MLTQGRLVPRQPWAIKRTTPTALHHEGIYITKYIHWNTGIKPTALHHYNIRNGVFIHWNAAIKPTALHRCNIRNAKYIHRYIGITPTALVINKQFIGLYQCSYYNTLPMIFQWIMPQIINQHAFPNAVSVVLLIAQGCQAIVQATLG